MRLFLKFLSVMAFAMTSFAAGAAEQIVVGATLYPHKVILEAVAPTLLSQYGYELKIVEYYDYGSPNEDLANGKLFANFTQHIPSLERYNKQHHTDLTAVIKTHIEPLGLYSKKYKTIEELPDGAVIAIPEGSADTARALELLQDRYLILLKNVPVPSLADIRDNPHRYKFKPMHPGRICSNIKKFDAAFVNANFAGEYGMYPKKDALVYESAASRYVNVIVVRKQDADSEPVKALQNVMRSHAVKSFMIRSLIPSGIYPVVR